MTRLLGCLIVTVIAATSLGKGSGNPGGTEGWKYGGNNCGCLTNSCTWTRANCTACCGAAAIPSGPLTPGQVTNCNAFCAQMGQPCCVDG